MQFNRSRWYEASELNISIIIIGFLLLMLGIIVRPTGFLSIVIWEQAEQNMTCKMAKWFGSVLIILYLVFFGNVFRIVSNDFVFAGQPPAWIFYIPWIAFCFTLPLPFFALLSWKLKYWRFFDRCFYTIFAIEMQFLFWFLWYWAIVA